MLHFYEYNFDVFRCAEYTNGFGDGFYIRSDPFIYSQEYHSTYVECCDADTEADGNGQWIYHEIEDCEGEISLEYFFSEDVHCVLLDLPSP